MREVLVGTQEAEIVLPMAICQYAFQIDRLTWIQRGPLSDLLFQRAFPIRATKVASDVLSDTLKKTFAKW